MFTSREEYKERVRRTDWINEEEGMAYRQTITCYGETPGEVTAVSFDFQKELLWTGTSGVSDLVRVGGVFEVDDFILCRVISVLTSAHRCTNTRHSRRPEKQYGSCGRSRQACCR